MGVAALVLGIISILIAFIPFCGVIAFLPALIGFILGIVFVVGGKKRNEPVGIGIAGLVLNLIALLVIIIGLLIRSYLTRLNLLLVPRIAAVVIVVVGIMAFVSIVGYKLGFTAGLQVTLFPMIIISWTIERMSVLWEEQGAKEVLRQGGGSLLVSILTLMVMSNSYIQYLTFTFPELLLLLLAVILAIGAYSGYRFTEFIRFEPMIRGDKNAPGNS